MEQDEVNGGVLGELLMQSGLIVPYSKDFILLLEKGCRDFLEEQLNFDVFADFALSYTKNSCSDILKEHIRELIDENEELPPCVWNTLAFYIMYLTIINKEDEKEKAIYSCMLQNILVRCKGHWEELKFPSYLMRLYDFMDVYLQDNEVGNGDFPYDFLETMFSDTDSLRTTLDTEEEQRKLKVIGKYAWKHRLEEVINREFQYQNPYLKAMAFLQYLFENRPDVFIHDGVFELIRESKFPKSKKEETLEKIIETIRNSDIILEETRWSKSSIILSLLSGEYVTDDTFLQEKFSPKEFFVCVYYELLLESILN